MKVLLTGSSGFLGWHMRVRLHALTDHEVVPVPRSQWSALPELVQGADAVIHVAGVNRGTARAVQGDNIALAEALASAVRASGSVTRVVYANSIQADNESPYGRGKRSAGDLLTSAAEVSGAVYVDVRLPNLFGEHGQPRYNSFVATFVDAVLSNAVPEIEDRAVKLLHVQDAAQSLITGLTTSKRALEPTGTPTTVHTVFDLLRSFADRYASGDIPPLTTKLDVDLFNTLRAAMFPDRYPIDLTVHQDERGRLVEAVRAHGGQGQTFFSTTAPGKSRGDHFHLAKVERFIVLNGTAQVALRRLFSDDVVTFDVRGDAPQIIDMPTMWAHNITNTGDSEVSTLFWTNTLFDPASPDTCPEPVHAKAEVPAS